MFKCIECNRPVEHKETTCSDECFAEWAKHQVPVSLETELAIEIAIRQGRIKFQKK